MFKPLGRLFASAPPGRALLEALVAQSLPTLVALLLGMRSPFFVFMRSGESFILVIGPLCLVWAALRMRLPERSSLGWQLAEEAAVGTVLGVLPALLVVAMVLDIANGDLGAPSRAAANFQHRIPPLIFAAVLVAIFCGAFLSCRVGVRAIAFWNRLRSRRLLWSLTHAHLMLVVLGSTLISVPVVGTYIYFNHGFLIGLVPILFFIAAFTVIALLVVLPPSALFSYIFARRTTRRLESLTDATSELRAGNYEVRIPVEGADEVALLQANFNAMAAELEQAVRQVQAERDTVAKLLQARRELVASVSHELRTPVATLRSYLESTRLHWDGAPPPTLRQDLEVMEHETIHLQALIADLFTLARAEVARLELHLEPTDLAGLAQRIVETAAPLAWRGNRVQVVADTSGALPAALVDASRMQQVVQNLLHNGVRHTPPGGIVAVEVEADDTGLILRVRDTGEGIAAQELPRIWERFYRTERSRDQALSGTGLGLALVKELTEAMGGSVAVESVPGEGSCFSVRVPRAASTDRSADTAPLPERARAS